MPRLLLIMFGVCSMFSQADAFSPLLLPDTQSRSANGEPGSRYWQQQVDYSLKVKLDTLNNSLQATADVTYYNNSADSLNDLWFEVPLNRFLPDSISSALLPAPLPLAGVTQMSVAANHQPLTLLRQDTFYRVHLPQALKPGQQQHLSFAWQLTLPSRSDPRRPRAGVEMIASDSKLFGIAQWFPRAVAYTDNGFALTPFLGDAEFSPELGNYHLEIDVPAGYMVLASGELQNTAEVFSDQQLHAWQQHTPQLMRLNNPLNNSLRVVWKFEANAVRDVAFAAGNKLIWQTSLFELNGRQQRLNLIYPDNGRWLWHKYGLAAMTHSVQQLSRLVGEFPFNSLNVVNITGIGMEYPGLKFVGFRGPDADINGPAPQYSRTEKYDVIGGTIHEVAHSYFPMLVNTDEREQGFFDEGVTSYLAFMLEQAWGKDFQSFYGKPEEVAPAMLAADYAAPVTRADHFSDKLSSHYHVPAVALVILRQHILGAEQFDTTFKGFVSSWRGKRARFSDFIRYFHAQTGQDLAWFWRGWFYSNQHVDIAVQSVELDENGMLQLIIENRGGIVTPFNVSLTTAEGTIKSRDVPVDIWRLNNRTARVLWQLPKAVKVVKVTLDKDRITGDARPENNNWPSF